MRTTRFAGRYKFSYPNQIMGFKYNEHNPLHQIVSNNWRMGLNLALRIGYDFT